MRLAGLGYDSFKKSLEVSVANVSSYKEMKKQIFDNFYVYADSFSYGMTVAGNEAEECLYDFKPLQILWAKENNVSYNDHSWQTDIIMAQISKFKPDVLYFQDIHSMPIHIKTQLKNNFPFIKLLVLFRGWPGGNLNFYRQEFKFADLIFVGSPILLDKFNQAGLNPPTLMYHSFDARILKSINEPIKYDFTFVGTTGYKQAGHSARYWMLLELLKKTNIVLWPQEYHWASDSYNRGLNKEDYLSKNWSNFAFTFFDSNYVKDPTYPLSFLVPERCHGSNVPYHVCFGLDMYKILQASKISFNRHCNDARSEWDNMRMFQATGVGSCMLVEKANNSKDLFEEDKEVVVYSSLDECVEKAKYLLDHEDERIKVAKAGQQRTLKDHDVTKRCAEMNDVIRKLI